MEAIVEAIWAWIKGINILVCPLFYGNLREYSNILRGIIFLRNENIVHIKKEFIKYLAPYMEAILPAKKGI